ncbi:MAG: PAS domain S-box protein, partial [Candidatus Methanoperedens sp.]
VIFLAALLILSDVFLTNMVPSYDDIPRIFMFTVIGFLVAVLSERLAKSEGMVNGRTSELRESEAKYRTLYESSSDAIMLLDEKGFFDCNNATLRMFGFLKKEDFIKVHPSDVSPPYQPDGTDSLTAANNKISEAFRKGMNSFEWVHRRKNGEDFPAEVLLTAFQLNGKRVLQATVRDITERKKIEGALKKSKEFIETVLNSMNDAISVIDVNDFRIIDVNTPFLKIYGLKREEVIGKTCYEITHKCAEPCAPPDDICPLLGTLETGKYSRAEHVHYTMNGEKRYVEIATSPIKDENGKVINVIHVARDITERKQAEEALKESEKYLKTIFNSVKTGLLIIDVETHRILDVNPVAAELIGSDRNKIIGSICNKFICPADTGKCPITDLGQKVDNSERVLLTVKGDRIPILKTVVPVTLNDKNIFIESFTDITERKQAEEALRLARDEAQSANMAKTNFLNTMSHELRTPLNAVLGFSEILKQKTSGELNEKQEHFIDNIITGGNNLHNIISQILEVVRVDEGTLELHIETIPVPETVDEVIGVIKECAAKKNVLIEKNLDPELEYIEADKQKFRQVFINLLDNAVKFSKLEGGNITITAKKEGEMARFSVSDTGIGIREDDAGKLFQKFTQLDIGTTRKYQGTGIGLAISKQLVELHGGKIMIESKYGEGSTFTFLIPLIAKKGGENKGSNWGK